MSALFLILSASVKSRHISQVDHPAGHPPQILGRRAAHRGYPHSPTGFGLCRPKSASADEGRRMDKKGTFLFFMAQIPSLVELLQAGAHFGHQTSHWHPKMKPFIFGERSGIHIIHLEETQKALGHALSFLKSVTARGGLVLFVGTKRQAQETVKKYADECGMPFVNERWLGGTLTNFGQIKNTIKELKTLKDQRDKGELRKYTKREQLMIQRQIEEMEGKLGGIATLERVPDVLFIYDVRNEKTALEEAKSIGIKVVAVCDSNVNPQDVDYVIPGNDDAVKAIALFARLAAEAIKEGTAEAARTKAATATKEVAKTN